MMTMEEVVKFMAIIIPPTLLFIVICFIVFVRWGIRDNKRNRKTPPDRFAD